MHARVLPVPVTGLHCGDLAVMLTAGTLTACSRSP